MVRPSSFVDVTTSTFLPLIVMGSNTLLGLLKAYPELFAFGFF
jgi:hypothetical protein